MPEFTNTILHDNNYQGKPGTCLQCGKVLKHEHGLPGPGYMADGLFCSISCGYRWALPLARAGIRQRYNEDDQLIWYQEGHSES